MANYTGTSYLWSVIEDLFDDDVLTRANHYKAGLHRLLDGIFAVRDIAFRTAAALASQEAGSPAVVRGSVVLGSLAFYDPIDTPLGALDGKTLILTTDLAGPVTVTFAQPQSPAQAASQINSQASATGIIATVDDGYDFATSTYTAANVGKLLLTRLGGGTASITIGAGTANATLGLSAATTTGSGTVNDGTTSVGFAGYASGSTVIAAGTLRNALEEIITVLEQVTNAAAASVAKAGDTMTGGLTAPSLTVNNASNTLTLASRSVTRSIEGVVSALSSDWVHSATGRFISLVTTGDNLVIPLDVPHGAILTDVSVTFAGGSGHVGLPAVMPNVTVYKTDLATGTDTTVGTADDGSASVVAYESVHEFGPSGLSETVDKSAFRYNVTLRSEAGANATTGGIFYGGKATFTVTRIDEA